MTADRIAPLALARVHLTYAWRHRRLLRLRGARLFTEMVQCRKLVDRDARMPVCADKLAVKALVADALGAEWVVPTLWAGADLPAVPRWPRPFVIKSRHGCNHTAFVRDDAADWNAIRRRTARWLEASYGGWLDEWIYRDLERGLLVEPFIGATDTLPIDYKFYVFGGRVEHIQVHLDREHAHRWLVLDRDWRPFAVQGEVPPRPSALSDMIAAAETLGAGFDFVRVDLYQPGAVPLFGEMSFYPGSGLDPFEPRSLDAQMGALWLAARGGVGWFEADQPVELSPEAAMIR